MAEISCVRTFLGSHKSDVTISKVFPQLLIFSLHPLNFTIIHSLLISNNRNTRSGVSMLKHVQSQVQQLS